MCAAVGVGDRARLVDAALQRRAPARVAADEADRPVAGARRQRQRAEPHELGPQDLRLAGADPRGDLGAAQNRAASRSTAGCRAGSSAARSTRRNGLVCTITPGAGPVGLDPDRPRGTCAAPNRRRSSCQVIEPVEQRNHQPRRRPDPLQRGMQAGRLGRDEQHLDGCSRRAVRRGVGGEVAEPDALAPRGRSALIASAVAPRRRPHVGPCRRGQRRRRGTRRLRPAREPRSASWAAGCQSPRYMLGPSAAGRHRPPRPQGTYSIVAR